MYSHDEILEIIWHPDETAYAMVFAILGLEALMLQTIRVASDQAKRDATRGGNPLSHSMTARKAIP